MALFVRNVDLFCLGKENKNNLLIGIKKSLQVFFYNIRTGFCDLQTVGDRNNFRASAILSIEFDPLGMVHHLELT